MNMVNYIVYYINLLERKDRKNNIEKQLGDIFPKNKINRINAIKHATGYIGCSSSHINAIKHFLESDNQYCFIFEDDFIFLYKPNETKKILNNIFKTDFNVVMLAYNSYTIKLGIENELSLFNLANVEDGQVAAGYILNKKFGQQLLDNFIEGNCNLVVGENPNIYAVDQFWKKLQTKKNKFYACIPCLGTQYENFSDIENKIISYPHCNTCFMLILSCEKYKNRRNEQMKNMHMCPFIYKYFVGKRNNIYNMHDPQINPDIVYLDCEDNYESLVLKRELAMKWIIDNYPNVNHIFKTDDDIVFDFSKLFEFYRTILKYKINYGGHLVTTYTDASTYHNGKCDSNELNNKSMKIKPFTKYCSGGGYFISVSLSKHIIKDSSIPKNTIFEDYEVGEYLNSKGVYPISLNIHKVACFW